jgi:hypothetical protein
MAVLDYRNRDAAGTEHSTGPRRSPASVVLGVSLVVAVGLIVVGRVIDRDEHLSGIRYNAAFIVVAITGA